VIKLLNNLAQPLTFVHSGTVIKLRGQELSSTLDSALLTEYVRGLIKRGYLSVLPS